MRAIFWLGDEAVMLQGGARMLRGQRLYGDFFQFHPPGGFMLVAGWLGLVGDYLWSARCLAIVTVAGIACLIFLACHRVSRHAPSSALVALAWVVMSQRFGTQINHHWFTTFFSMLVVWATLASVGSPGGRRGWAFLAGLAGGAAAMVVPTRGALILLAALPFFVSLRGDRVRSLAYLAASVCVPAALVGFVMAQGTLLAAFDSVILYPLQSYTSIQPVPFGHWVSAQDLPLLLVWPVTFVLTAILWTQNRKRGVDDELFWPCVAFAVAGLIGCYPRPDIAHVAFSTPWVTPLFVHAVGQLAPRWRSAVAGMAALVSLPAPMMFYWNAERAWNGEVVVTPRGALAIPGNPDGIVQILDWLASKPASDGYFFYPYQPMLPYLAARNHVAPYDLFVPEYTTPRQYRDSCVAVLSGATWAVIHRKSADPGFLQQVFPAMRNAEPLEVRRFEQILDQAFAFEAQVGAFEIRRRDGAINKTACDGIDG